MKSSQNSSAVTVGIFLFVLYLLCLLWQYLLTDPALKTLHLQLLRMSFPGFTGMTIGSMLWGAVLSFVYGWLGAAAYGLISSKGSCCK